MPNPGLIPEQKLILENLSKMLAKNAALQFAGFFGIDGVESSPVPMPEMRVLGHAFGAIIVQGADFRLTLKIHSDLKPLRPLCAKNLLLPEEQVDERMTRDFLREIANLLGGAIRTELSRNKVDAGISLPLSSRGFDEMFFNVIENQKNILQVQRMSWGADSLLITMLVEITDWETLQPMKDYKVDAATVDEFENLVNQGK